MGTAGYPWLSLSEAVTSTAAGHDRREMRINDLGSIFQKSDIAEELETIFCMPFHNFPFVFSQFCRFP